MKINFFGLYLTQADVYHYDAQKHKLDKATDYCINKQLDEAHQALPRADEELNEQIEKNDNIKM